MIPITQHRENISAGIQNSVEFSVKAANFGHLFHILRNQTYSDPILAVIREYATNSFDSHVASGKKETPIKVSLPSQLDPSLKIRDYGHGLTDEEIKDIYASYGESSKRTSQEATGMLGIGCKSGFAYNDSFMVNSYQNGVMTIWNAFIDPSNRGAMSKMGDLETTEPNGIEIVIPVKGKDIETFKTKAFKFFSFWVLPPEFENASEADLTYFKETRNAADFNFSGPNWALDAKHRGPSYALMGNIPYPIDFSMIKAGISQSMFNILCEGKARLIFNLGELEFSASRESLQYTDFTKKSLTAAVNLMEAELVAQIEKEFYSKKTLWDAKIAFAEMTDFNGRLYNLRYLIAKKLCFHGSAISDQHFSLPDTFAVLYLKKKTIYGGDSSLRVRRTDVSKITPKKTALVVFNDSKIENGITNRLVGPIEAGEYSEIYVLNFLSEEDKKAWIASSKFDGPCKRLADMKKEPLSKYYQKNTPTIPQGKRSNAFFFTKSPKHFSYKDEGRWSKSYIEIENTVGFYVEMDSLGYVIADKANPLVDKNCFFRVFNLAKAFGMPLGSPVYGFLSSSLPKAQANKQLINLFDFIKTEAKKAFSDPLFSQKFIDHRDAFGFNNELESLELVAKEFSFKKNPDLESAASDVAKRLYAFKQDKKFAEHFSLLNLVNKYADLSLPVGTPTLYMSEFYKALEKRYPLLMAVVKENAYSLRYNKDFKNKVQEYIDFIETVTPVAPKV